MQSRDGTVNFNQTPPPYHRHEFAQLRLRLPATGLVNTQGYQRASVPESRLFAHNDSSRSSRSACVPSRCLTLPVLIFSSSSISTLFLGRRILPAATSNSSSSLPSSAENGTSFATGRFLSRITISSPPLAKVRYLLRRFLSSATLTLRMGG